MKFALTVLIMITLLAAIGPARTKPSLVYPEAHTSFSAMQIRTAFWPGVAREKIEAGPLSLEIRVRTTEIDEANAEALPVSRFAVNTEFSASLDPLSIRAIVGLYLQTNRTRRMREARSQQSPATRKALPSGRAFTFDGLMSGS